MATVTVGAENGNDIDLYFEDHGSGPPVVLVHGYPQRALVGAARARATRRGLPRDQLRPTRVRPVGPADHRLRLRHLRRRPQRPAGAACAGRRGPRRLLDGDREVTRYLGNYGSARVRKAALLGAIPPFLLKTDDNPEGVPGDVFEGIKAAIVADRYAYFKDFFDNFYNVDVFGGSRISEQAWQASFNVAAGASPYASFACVDSWLTDFRGDLPKIDVPTLVVHGTEDRILPYGATAQRLPTGRRPPAGHCRGRPTQHRLDPPRRGQQALLEFLAD